MGQRKTVFVVGAGASAEVGLPVGTALVQMIASLVDFRADDLGRLRVPANYDFRAAVIQALASSKNGDERVAIAVANSIRQAQHDIVSIDRYIDSHRENIALAICAKMAIVSAIFSAERASNLFVSESNIHNSLDTSRLNKTWYSKLFKRLSASRTPHEFRAKLEEISFVTFNYDRCIEHYFQRILPIYYPFLDGNQRSEILSGLEVKHVYGSIGSLPFLDAATGQAFGVEIAAHQLAACAARIRTFTERREHDFEEMVTIQQRLKAAEQIVFLGFGFDKANVKLLLNDQSPNTEVAMPRPVYATFTDPSQVNRSLVTAKLKALAAGGDVSLTEPHQKCADLFDVFDRALQL